MSERKVLNKYYPPDFDPSKIKRRKGFNKDKQMVIRLMAPFSMRCNRCAEYIYKGKKFNARKETAVDEEYFGIKIFRFYIKCTQCSSEITFKTDPKNADYTMEHGATRNFENWTEADPSGSRTAIPDAAADDEYDSDGNPLEGKIQKDAMADLERSQEASMREMELMDELAELRQRNARVETNHVDPDMLLSQLHAERVDLEEEKKKLEEQEEDDLLVARYFAKVPMGPPGLPILKGKGKGKEKAIAPPGIELDEAPEPEGSDDGASEEEEAIPEPSAVTIKRRPAAEGSDTNGLSEPSVASLLAAKGKVLDNGSANGTGPGGAGQAQAAAKRKREGMQKMLGIKKKK